MSKRSKPSVRKLNTDLFPKKARKALQRVFKLRKKSITLH